MTTTRFLSENAEVDLLYKELADHDVQPLWELPGLLTTAPVVAARPHLWAAIELRRLAELAGALVPVERGGDRRVLACANPGLGGAPYAVGTLWAAVQYLGPGESELRYGGGSGLVPAQLDHGRPARSPLLVYRWADTDRALRRQMDGPFDWARIRYTDPTTGRDVMPTMRCELLRVQAGARTPGRRQTGGHVGCVLHGTGTVTVGDEHYRVGPGDIVAIPSWNLLTIQADDELDFLLHQRRARTRRARALPRAAHVMTRDPWLIAGGGIGGLSTGLALARRGQAVRLIERAEKFGEIGAGLQIGANASRAMQRLGCFRPSRRSPCIPLGRC